MRGTAARYFRVAVTAVVGARSGKSAGYFRLYALPGKAWELCGTAGSMRRIFTCPAGWGEGGHSRAGCPGWANPRHPGRRAATAGAGARDGRGPASATARNVSAIRRPRTSTSGRRKITSARFPTRHRVSPPAEGSRARAKRALRIPENDYTRGRPGCQDAADPSPGLSAPRSSPGSRRSPGRPRGHRGSPPGPRDRTSRAG
jgi:hypothetical protein